MPSLLTHCHCQVAHAPDCEEVLRAQHLLLQLYHLPQLALCLGVLALKVQRQCYEVLAFKRIWVLRAQQPAVQSILFGAVLLCHVVLPRCKHHVCGLVACLSCSQSCGIIMGSTSACIQRQSLLRFMLSTGNQRLLDAQRKLRVADVCSNLGKDTHTVTFQGCRGSAHVQPLEQLLQVWHFVCQYLQSCRSLCFHGVPDFKKAPYSGQCFPLFIQAEQGRFSLAHNTCQMGDIIEL
mmetsp:Transcript_9059/g.24344  ORF Transcript_9059/g.24344 Transcript_9059/m.24344 type:complete len:236 (-) Transcript_9059:533-1240(-)